MYNAATVIHLFMNIQGLMEMIMSLYNGKTSLGTEMTYACSLGTLLTVKIMIMTKQGLCTTPPEHSQGVIRLVKSGITLGSGTHTSLSQISRKPINCTAILMVMGHMP